jgi:hypothetical protein
MDNEWKNSLRERFSDYSAPEPEGLWEGIEQGIAGKPRRKMLPVWIFSGLAAAAAVALVVFLHPEKTPETPGMQMQAPLAESVQAAPVTPDPAASSSSATTGDHKDASAPSKSLPFAVASRQTLLSAATPIPSVPVSDETVPDAVPSVVSVKEEMPGQAGHDNQTVSGQAGRDDRIVSVTEVPKENQEQEAVVILPVGVKPSWKRFSVGAGREGGQPVLEQSEGVGLNRTGSYLTRATYNGQKKTSDLMQMLSNNRASTYEARHGAPVRMGVSVAWGLSPHLSLVSGLNWTSLTSTFDEKTAGDTQTSTRQNLGYLGVPLRLEAGFEPVKRLRLYAGAGGMAEKGLMSTSETRSYIGDHLEDSVTGHPDTGGLLWSVGATAGAEYRINRTLGLYVAPGIEYHFDNGAEARSAYTEKPLHWNVALGVRFNFGN